MKLLTTIKGFINDLLAQKLRTTLTIFGIVWGTVAIIVLLAFGNGFQKQTMKTMNSIGESVILLFPGQTAKPFQGYGANRSIRLREEDSHLLKSEIREILSLSPEYSTWRAALRVGSNTRTPNVTGVYPIYSTIRHVYASAGGRFINEMDLENKRRVVFLGNELADRNKHDSAERFFRKAASTLLDDQYVIGQYIGFLEKSGQDDKAERGGHKEVIDLLERSGAGK